MAQNKYSPSIHTATNKPLGLQGLPAHGATYILDNTSSPPKYRPYMNTAEVLLYLSHDTPAIQTKYRSGHFDIIINTGGTLENGVITGGTYSVYWFSPGQTDGDLVLKQAEVDLSDIEQAISGLNDSITDLYQQIEDLGSYKQNAEYAPSQIPAWLNAVIVDGKTTVPQALDAIIAKVNLNNTAINILDNDQKTLKLFKKAYFTR